MKIELIEGERNTKSEEVVCMSEKALICDNVCKYFVEKRQDDKRSFREKLGQIFRSEKKKVKAVHKINFQMGKGEVFGIIGPNGSGKSTLVRLISTLLILDEGEIKIFGLDVEKDRFEVRKMINRVSVDAAFFKKLSPLENLRYAARLYGVPVKEAQQRAMDILVRLGLEEKRLNISLEGMSRGMQQKVAIARALLTSPILLLLDEPTTGLDPKSKRSVQGFITEIRDTHNATVLLTTHDMNEAERLCDRIAILDRGRFIAMGTLDELRAKASEDGNDHSDMSLEDIFFELTGKGWEGDEEE